MNVTEGYRLVGLRSLDTGLGAERLIGKLELYFINSNDPRC